MSLPLGKMWVLGDLHYIGSTLYNCGKPDSAIDRNVKQDRLRRRVAMKKMSQQPEASFFPLVVGMLGLWAPSSLQVVRTTVNGMTVD